MGVPTTSAKLCVSGLCGGADRVGFDGADYDREVKLSGYVVCEIGTRMLPQLSVQPPYWVLLDFPGHSGVKITDKPAVRERKTAKMPQENLLSFIGTAVASASRPCSGEVAMSFSSLEFALALRSNSLPCEAALRRDCTESRPSCLVFFFLSAGPTDSRILGKPEVECPRLNWCVA